MNVDSFAHWGHSVGSTYLTRDGHSALVVAFGVRLDWPPPPGLEQGWPTKAIVEVHALITDRLQAEKPVPIKDPHEWPRIILDSMGNWKGGDPIPDATARAGESHPLDLVHLKKGAARIA